MAQRLIQLVAGICIAAFSTLSWGQDAHQLPYPEDAFDPQQLIAWSRLQKPQPTPQPLPPPDKAVPQPDQPQEQQPKTAPADPGSQSAPTQSFVGTIVNSGNHYVLRVSSAKDYELDGAGDAEQYQNQNVRVTGTLDKSTQETSEQLSILKTAEFQAYPGHEFPSLACDLTGTCSARGFQRHYAPATASLLRCRYRFTSAKLAHSR